MIQLISVSEVASSSNLSKQSIFNNLKALDIEIVKHKNKAYISNDEDLQRLLKRLEDNNKGMLTKILDSDNKDINKHVVKLINSHATSINIGSTDTVDKVVKQDVNEVDELNKQLDELIKENNRLIEANKTLNNKVASLNAELNSLNNQSEVIQLLKSQIGDMKQSHEKEIRRLEDDKENLQNNINNLDERLEESLNLVSQQQSLALKLQSDLDTIEAKQSHSDVSNHVHAEREDRSNQKQSSFLSRLFKR